MASAAGLGWPGEAGADSGDGTAGGTVPRPSRALGLGWPTAPVSHAAQVPVPVGAGVYPDGNEGDMRRRRGAAIRPAGETEAKASAPDPPVAGKHESHAGPPQSHRAQSGTGPSSTPPGHAAARHGEPGTVQSGTVQSGTGDEGAGVATGSGRHELAVPAARQPDEDIESGPVVRRAAAGGSRAERAWPRPGCLPGDHDRQPEGWRGQDHHGGQSRRRPGPARLACAGHRPGPAGQRVHGAGCGAPGRDHVDLSRAGRRPAAGRDHPRG